MAPIKKINTESVVVLLAGDSGDGIQLAGEQLVRTSTAMGNYVYTFPEYPAEIRAPAGTIAGVSGYQINLSSKKNSILGDRIDVLLALNPSSLAVNLKHLSDGAVIICNSDAFTEDNLDKISLKSNPLSDGTLEKFKVIAIPMNRCLENALQDLSFTRKQEIGKCRNFFALGVLYWMFRRSLAPSESWIKSRFKNRPNLIMANTYALEAGYSYADTHPDCNIQYSIINKQIEIGTYRAVTGTEATVYGLIAAAAAQKKSCFTGHTLLHPQATSCTTCQNTRISMFLHSRLKMKLPQLVWQ